MSASLRLKRAQCYAATEATEMAIADLSRALLIQPDNAAVYLELSSLRLEIGELAESVSALKDCLRLDPDQKACKAQYTRLRKLDKAMKSLEDAVAKSKLLTSRDMLLENNGLVAQVEALGSKQVRARVYKQACLVFNQVSFVFDTQQKIAQKDG